MYPEPLYQSFTITSPWLGTFHYYVEELRFYREALDDAARLVQSRPIKQIHRYAYDIAYRDACWTARLDR